MADVRRERRRKDSSEMIDEEIWRTESELAAELRRLREGRGWTLEEVAERDDYLYAERMTEIETSGRITAKELLHLEDMYELGKHSLTVRPDAPESELLKLERQTLGLYEDMQRIIEAEPLPLNETPEVRQGRIDGMRGEVECQRRVVMALEARLARETLRLPFEVPIVSVVERTADVSSEVARDA